MPRRAAAAAALFTLALSACSGDRSDSPSPVEAPVAGGTLRQGLVKVGSLDPARASTVSERVLADQLYDGLTTWDPVSGEAQPAVAARWQSTNGNRTWTFHLRPDAKAANGETITASDVKTTLEEAVRGGTPLSDLLAPIAGYGSYAADPAVGGLSGVTTPDANTVRIELDAPVADLPLLLGNPAFGIKHRAGDGTTVTTGPFALANVNGDQGVSLVKAQGSDALLERIETTFYGDLDGAYEAFKAGQLDWVPVSPTKAVEAGREYGSHLFRPSLRSLYLSINTQLPQYSDRRFREAIIRAIDRPAAVRAAAGDVRMLNSINTDAVPNDERALCAVTCAYGIEAARKLVKEAYPNGSPPPVVINVLEGEPLNADVRDRIVKDLATAGITAEIRAVPADQFGAVTVAEGRELLQTGWSAAYPSAEATLLPLFLSNSRANVSNFRDADIDRRLQEAQGLIDDRQRSEAFEAIERDLLAVVPMVPLMQFPVASVAAPPVRGLSVQPTGNFDASTVWLAPAT